MMMMLLVGIVMMHMDHERHGIAIVINIQMWYDVRSKIHSYSLDGYYSDYYYSDSDSDSHYCCCYESSLSDSSQYLY